MNGKTFLDTNIIVYACDNDSPRKQSIARGKMAELASWQSGCISTQVLQEFYVTATRKLGVAPLDAKAIMQSLHGFEVVTITPGNIQGAVDGNILWQVSFWDALILTSARKAKCSTLLTEDLNHGQVIEGVRIVNPFLAP